MDLFMLYFIRGPSAALSLLLTFFVALGLCLNYNSTALIIAVDADSVNQASYLLNGYGIGYEILEVPVSGTNLPALETPAGGNYGIFVLVSRVEYNGTSALTADQFGLLYSYQLKYHVRMIHLDVDPIADFGVELVAACCDNEAEQNLTLEANIQIKEFPNAGLRITNLSTVDLYHYGASILPENSSTTTAFIIFEPNNIIPNKTVGGVINRLEDGREQMSFFIETADWSSTATYLQHIWIQWGYRGLYQGYRRVHLGTQVDDLFLQTAVYASQEIFRLRAEDLLNHVQWTYDINHRLNNGSTYFLEFGFNANGNLIYDYDVTKNITQFTCEQPVFTDWNEPTELEYQKPLGSGNNKWPTTPMFGWTATCIFLDPLADFFANQTNRDAFGLVSHTFTHLELNNATYHDTLREIQFNLIYAELLNFTNAAKFSGSGLIPPAITGMHNGDALRAFADMGLWNVIGDNTRPALRNNVSYYWPLMTTMEENGFDGYQITPRWATRIYYNCAEAPCDVQQWIDTEGGTPGGDIYSLLDLERPRVANLLLSLYHDPYMFHQPNLRQIDVEPVMINGKLQQLSLIQMWTETVVAEFNRLVDWPTITLRHDHIAMAFNQRMLLDGCAPYLQITMSSQSQSSNQSITGFTIFSSKVNNTCEVPIPVTVPASLVSTKGFRVEQIGTDPATIWVTLDGAAESFVLEHPISV